jgi:hypothetical protein
MNLSMTINEPGLRAPIIASGNGVVDLRDHAASISIGFNLPQQASAQLGTSTMRIGMITTAGAMYMKFPQTMAGQIPGLAARPWVKVDLTKLAGLPGLSSLTSNPTMSDPSHMLDYLRAISDGVTNQGPQVLDGVRTTHYQASIDLSRLADAAPASDRDALQKASSQLEQATGGQGLPVDVWIDGAGLVRRMDMSITGAAGAGAGAGMQETMVANFTDYGPQAPPSPPSPDQVQDLTGLLSHSS